MIQGYNQGFALPDVQLYKGIARCLLLVFLIFQILYFIGFTCFIP